MAVYKHPILLSTPTRDNREREYENGDIADCIITFKGSDKMKEKITKHLLFRLDIYAIISRLLKIVL